MEELIAKRYIKGLSQSLEAAELENVSTLFTVLADAYSDAKFNQIIFSKDVDQATKTALLLECVKSAQSEKVNNFIKLLVENGRIGIVPTMAEVLRKEIGRQKNTYHGKVYSDTEIDSATVDNLALGLHKKMNATVTLEFVKSDYNGVKVEVEDLGIEVNFSKSRLNMQLVDHILKAI